MKYQAKALMAGLVLSVLALTACGGGNDDSGNTAPKTETTVSATATATASPKATATETAVKALTEEDAKQAGIDYMADTPKAHGIDLAESMKSYLDPAVKATFPDHDPQDGAKQLLSPYLMLSDNANLQKARGENDPSDGKLLYGYEDKMEGEYLNALTTAMDDEKYPFLSATRNGYVTTIDGVDYHANGKFWQTSFNSAPGINILNDSKGSRLFVKGTRTSTIATTEGVVIKCESEYGVAGSPSTIGTATTWLLSGTHDGDLKCEVIDGSHAG